MKYYSYCNQDARSDKGLLSQMVRLSETTRATVIDCRLVLCPELCSALKLYYGIDTRAKPLR